MGVVHVLPVGDLVPHDEIGDECVCGPATKAIKADDGSIDWLVVHHSLDGREPSEPPATPGG